MLAVQNSPALASAKTLSNLTVFQFEFQTQKATGSILVLPNLCLILFTSQHKI